MSAHDSEDFKKEVAKAYMRGDKSIQQPTVDCKNKLWCTNFTYMCQPNEKLRYNCSIIDLFDRSVVSSLNSDYISNKYT